MLFNSFEFGVFLPIVFSIYWLLGYLGRKSQNVFLVLASYVFYGWWDWRFLGLILASSLIDYWIGGQIKAKPNHKKSLLLISVVFNLGMLFVVKYYNFFIDSFIASFSFLGYPLDLPELDWILPVGISFYTFQTMSYTIDVYKGKMEPTRELISFLAFVSFFPQLVAGPIERAKNLLPQFYTKRTFDYASSVDGCRQILWGFFKKIVIADNCAAFVNPIFSNYDDSSGSSLLIASIFFAFQIYGDFSGYSDIAIGTARLFGFKLSKNFAFPYFSRDIGEFWRRWHISLTTWFRDYVYIPLGGSKNKKLVTLRNVFIVFAVSGMWHGANWTFLVWGLINAVCFLPLILLDRNRRYLDEIEGNVPSFKTALQILFTFSITVLAWVFFRSENIFQAVYILREIFSLSVLEAPAPVPLTLILLLLFFVVIEWLQKSKNHGLEIETDKTKRLLRWSIYLVVGLTIAWFGGAQEEFIYFQF